MPSSPARRFVLPSPSPHAYASYSDVEASGPSSPPLGFPAPLVHRGQQRIAIYYNADLNSFKTGRALFRLPSKSDEEEQPEQVFMFTPQVLKKTMCGEIVLCEVLLRCKDENLECSSKENKAEGHAAAASDSNSRSLYVLSGEKVAIKVDDRKSMQQLHDPQHPSSENPWKEISAMQLIGNNHPNVVGLITALFDDQYLYKVMPYFSGGNLQQLMNRTGGGGGGGIPERQARYCFRQILAALHHLQSRGICQRDLSTHNVMLDKHRCVLIDMGMSLRVPYSYPDDHCTDDVTDITAGTMRRLIHSQSHCGKLRFMAPEMYHKEDFDGFAIDLWSAACILFIMITGQHPYEKPDISDSGYYDLLDPCYYWDVGDVNQKMFAWGRAVSPEVVDLLKKMLKNDPRKRLSLADVMHHPWVFNPDVEAPKEIEPVGLG